jgi:PBP1b-binding outer membrane lipoprotein LpoB
MKKLISLIILVFILQSCDNKSKKNSEDEPLQQIENSNKVHPSKIR